MDKVRIEKIEPEAGEQTMDVTEPQVKTEATISVFMLSLFQIADQAKIIHLQTPVEAEHRVFGMFYDTFTDQLDTLVEAIAGKYGTDKLKFSQAAVMVYDYDFAKGSFFEMIDEILGSLFHEIFDREKDSELYNLVDEMKALANKAKFLLQMK